MLHICVVHTTRAKSLYTQLKETVIFKYKEDLAICEKDAGRGNKRRISQRSFFLNRWIELEILVKSRQHGDS